MNSQGKYQNWCKKAGFESKLAGDVAMQKLKAEQLQQMINGHLVEKKLADRIVSYSDKLFQQASIEWLVATNQVSLCNCLISHSTLHLIALPFVADSSP
jgi:hypothetical protein